MAQTAVEGTVETAESDNQTDQEQTVSQNQESHSAFGKLIGYYQQVLTSYQGFVSLFK